MTWQRKKPRPCEKKVFLNSVQSSMIEVLAFVRVPWVTLDILVIINIIQSPDRKIKIEKNPDLNLQEAIF